MLKRCLFAVFFGLFVLIVGPEGQGPKSASAYWVGANTTCPDMPGVGGLAGKCASVAEACKSWELFYGWPWIKTRPSYYTGQRLKGFVCVLLRQTVLGPIEHGIATDPHCDTGVDAPLSNSGCVDQNAAQLAMGRPACVDTGTTCKCKRALGKSNTVAPGNRGVGNPIGLAGFNKFQEATDFTTAGPEPFAFTRYYNSRSNRIWRHGHGVGWRHMFDRWMRFYPSWSAVSKVYMLRPNGQMITFTKSGSNYNPAKEFKNVKLTYSSATEDYTFRDADGTVETYNKYGGLRYFTLPSGNRISVTSIFITALNDYRLYRAWDSFGREIIFTHADDGSLTSVEAPDGRITKYVYDNAFLATGTPNKNRLKEVINPDDTPGTDADNPRVLYHYEDANNPFSLTGITNENGVRYATWSYDVNNKPILSEHAGGVDRVTIEHTSDWTRTVTNALGKTALYRMTWIDGYRRLTRIDGQASTNCPAADAFTSYDSNNFVASRTDWEGKVTTYVNNSRGLPTTITEASGTPEARTTTVTWHGTHNLPTQINAPGLRTDYTYTSGGLVLTRTETDLTTHTVPYATNGRTRTWTYTYNAQGLLASVDGPRVGVTDTTSYTYTAAGYLATVTNGLGHVTTVTSHDGMGRPLSVTDANGVVTDLTYDPRGRLLTVTVNGAGGNAVTTMAYTLAGDVARITRPDNSYLDFVYDPARRLTSIVNNLGERIDYTLNLVGNRTAVAIKDASSTVTKSMTATFDELGRIMTAVGAGAQTTAYAHDKNSLVVGVTDPLTRQTGYAYDALNRLIQVTDAATNTVPLAYDSQDNLTQVQDQRGLATDYVVDGFGYVIQVTSPDTGVTVNAYDEAGNLTQVTDARGVVTDYAYDALNRVTAKTFPAAPAENVTYTYDAVAAGFGKGRLTGITDPSGSTNWTYDERGNVLSEVRVINGVSFTTAYSYDLADNLASVTYPSGRVVTYLHDALGRVSSVLSRPTAGGTDVTLASSITFKPFGPLSGLTYGNGLALARTFDLDYRMTAETVTATGITAQDLGYSFDLASNILAANDNRVPARSQGFTYDALDRLTQGTGLYGQLDYTYDAVGNRLTRVKAGGGGFTETSTIGANDNRLVSVTGGAVNRSFTYSAAGHVTGDGTLGFTINNAGRNVEAKLSGTPIATYAHNALGQRVKKAIPAGATTLFHYATSGQLLATSDGTGANWTEYVWLGGMPLAQIDAGTIYYTHADHLGAPQALTDASKAIVWDASFRPFGETEAQSGSVTNLLRFPGQYFDAETGTHYNYFRDYDPALGRYLQSDPIGLAGGLSTYSYVGGNPLRYVDPTGEQAAPPLPTPFPVPIPLPPIADPNSKENKEWVRGAKQFLTYCLKAISGLVGGGDDDEFCRKEKEKAIQRCNKARYDPDAKHIWGGSFQQCMRNVLPEKCGGEPKWKGYKGKPRRKHYKFK